MKAAVWTLFGVLWTVVMALFIAAVWTSSTQDLSSRLGNTAGVLATGVVVGGIVGGLVGLLTSDGDIW